MKAPTRIFDLLDNYSHGNNDKPDALAGKINGEWIKFSSRAYVESVKSLSKAFLELGLKKGDTVATIMRNCPEWNFVDFALQQIGVAQVPIYPTISEENFRFIFEDAGVKYVIVSNFDLYRRIDKVVPEIPGIKEVFTVEPVKGLRSVQDLINRGQSLTSEAAVEEIKNGITEDELATIIYTSGTTGVPKGVMLSHRNVVSNFLTLAEILPKNTVFRAMSFLPLCHVYERVLNYLYQYCGISIYYAESIETIAQNLKEVNPEMFCAVPRVIEKFYDKIIAKGREQTGIKKQIFFWAVNLGYRFRLYNQNNIAFRIQHKIAEALVFTKWREALGGNIKIIVSGGAALQPRLGRIFWAAGIQLMEGYGLTETAPVIAVNNFQPFGVKIGTVGPVMPGVTVKLEKDGEICVKGPNVMMGYYNNPEATAEIIDKEGWLHTGDIGQLEPGKYFTFLRITDRKKEVFKTSGGKFIAPQPLENKYKESAFIENIMVVGENEAYPVALIVPNFEYFRGWAKIKGHKALNTKEEIANSPIVAKRLQRELDKFNAGIDQPAQVKRFHILDHDWTPETGELSMTLKLKRKALSKRYQEIIAGLYGRF
jgi:long-chain acyl-CoA synthetase